MENSRIARILYNLSLDMDYADYLEFAEDEIACIEKELQTLRNNNCDCLLQALEVIASRNESLEFWKEGRGDDDEI